MNKKFLTKVCAVAVAGAMLVGCGGIDAKATLVEINAGDTTDTISLGYANFAARYQQSMYDQFLMQYYGEGMWTSDMTGTGSTLEQDTKEGILDDMETQYLCKLHAADYGVEITDEDKTKIAEAVSKFMEDNSSETLEEMGATEEYVTEYLENRTYATRVQNAVVEADGEDAFTELVDTWKSEITWTVDEEKWETVKFDALFKSIASENDEAADDTAEETTVEDEATEDAE